MSQSEASGWMVAGQRRRREMRGFAVRNGSSRMMLSSSSGASSSEVVVALKQTLQAPPVTFTSLSLMPRWSMYSAAASTEA